MLIKFLVRMPEYLKKHPKKLLRNTQTNFIITNLSCPNRPNRRIHVPNVAFRPTEYKIGNTIKMDF